MRAEVVILSAAALLLGACQREAGLGAASSAPTPARAPVSAPASAGPHREPGLWQMRMSIHGVATVQQREICLDQEAEPKVALWGGQAKSRCSRDQADAQPDGSYRIAASCDQGAGGHVEVSGSMTGDAAKAYAVHIQRTTTRAADPMDDGRMEITTEFRRLGPCRPGQAGGDLESYGARVNVLAPG